MSKRDMAVCCAGNDASGSLAYLDRVALQRTDSLVTLRFAVPGIGPERLGRKRRPPTLRMNLATRAAIMNRTVSVGIEGNRPALVLPRDTAYLVRSRHGYVDRIIC